MWNKKKNLHGKEDKIYSKEIRMIENKKGAKKGKKRHINLYAKSFMVFRFVFLFR